MRFGLIFLFSIVTNGGFAITPTESLQRLIKGNQRYVSDQLEHPNRSQERRSEITGTQRPFATILGCSDSRVPVEIIFDQGLGDLFVVRVAGNVVDPVVLDSIEYSVKYLGSSLVMVMGHESCGAVTTVFNGNTQDIEDVARLIRPAITGARSVESAVKDNVRYMVDCLKGCVELRRLIVEKKIDVVGAYYELSSGRVEILQASSVSPTDMLIPAR